MHCVVWSGLFFNNLPPYEDKRVLLHIYTLFMRRTVACIIFVFNILSKSSLLPMVHVVAPWYQTRDGDFLRVRFHRMMYGVHELFKGAVQRWGLIFISPESNL
jgi:hypothetical protein